MKSANSRPVWFRRKIGNCLTVWVGLLLVTVIALAGSLVLVGPLSMATPSGTAETVEARPLSRSTSTITATAGPHGTMSPAGAVTVNYRANQAFSITPDTGYHIADVLVDGSSVGPVAKYTFKKVVADHTIAASFAINFYTITGSADSNGSISPSGEVTVNYGAEQTFAITPAAGYQVADVLVDGGSVGAVTSFAFSNCTGDHTIAARFGVGAPATHTIMASADSNGSISPSGAVMVSHGASQAFAITPAAGYQVGDVLVDGTSVGAVASYAFSDVTSDHTIAATFVPGTSATYTITASAGAHGVVSPSGAVTVSHGSNQAFTITPDNGYHVADVLVDGTSVGAVAGYTFYNLTGNHTLAASFALYAGITVVAAHDSPHPADASYVCDGLNDHVEIQAAINALGGSAGRVLLLEGTYYISSTVRVYQNLTLEGSGHATLLYLVDNSNCTVISNVGGYNIPRANVTIRNFRIDGNKSNQSGGHGILRTGEHATYDTLWVENCLGRGISHSWGDYTTIAGNTISNCTGRGIFLEETFWGEITNNQVYDCGLIFNTTEDRAVDIYGGGDNKVLNNYIDGGGTMRQIGAWDSPRVEIIGNTLVNGLGMGIAPYAQYAIIMNNTITNAGNNAIDTCGANDNWIEGNIISRVTSVPLGPSWIENSGICVNSSRSTVINNHIEFAGRAGIHIGPGNNDNQILNNVIRNCGQQGAGVAGIWVQIWATDAIVSGNVIRGNMCFDDQVVKTQQYGVWLDASNGYIDNIVIEGNDLRNNGTSGIWAYYADRVRNATIQDNQL